MLHALIGQVDAFIHWGTDGQNNLQLLRYQILNVFAGLFLLSTSILFIVRLAQGAWIHAFVDLVALAAVWIAMGMAKSGKFAPSVLLVTVAAPVLAFTLVLLGKYDGSLMIPQIGMCMLTSLLVISSPRWRVVYIGFCVAIMVIASYRDSPEPSQLLVFVIQTVLFATIFVCFARFFDRQDRNLQQTIGELQQSNEEKREANQGLNHANAALQEANSALNERMEELLVFTHVMSHDLKGPLTGIQGYADMLEFELKDAKTDSAEICRDYALEISKAARGMNSLIEDLLTYAKISHAVSSDEMVELQEVFASVEKQLAYQIKTQNVRIEVAKLPIIRGNAELFRTVIYNLFSNAIKYQPNDKPGHAPHIRAWSIASGKTVNLFIKDNGIGIAPEFRHELFTPFKRDRSSEYEGSGLGMSICQSIVEKFGGHILVHETSENGTTFKLSFPMLDSGSTSSAAKAPSLPTGTASRSNERRIG